MRKYYSEAYEALHELDMGLFAVGKISEAELRKFEKDCFIDEDGTNELGETPQEETAHKSA